VVVFWCGWGGGGGGGVWVVLFFFFQAEDGIRDKLVTGVQTCALPIWARLGRDRGGRARLAGDDGPRDGDAPGPAQPAGLGQPADPRAAGRPARQADGAPERRQRRGVRRVLGGGGARHPEPRPV